MAFLNEQGLERLWQHVVAKIEDSEGANAELPDNVTYHGEEDIEDTTAPINADTLGGYTVDSLLNKIYPVGSVYVSSTNTNPSASLGGTWELEDKEFANRYDGTLANYVTLNTTNCSAVTGSLLWYGHEIVCGTTLTPVVAITDSTLEMFTFDLASIGITAIANPLYHTSMADGGQAVLSFNINSSGVFSTRDVIVRGSETASLGTSYTPYVTYRLQVRPVDMLDEFCDKFYWKRIA